MQQQSGQSRVWHYWRRALVSAAAIAALCGTFAGEAKAACVTKGEHPHITAATPKAGFNASNALSFGNPLESHDSIVGLWNVTFLFGNGPDVFDQGFQQWHLGGTELMVDNAVSPSFGNVCIGVWKQAAARTYKLKHMTFNWDAQGKQAGTFVLTMTVRLDRRGNGYVGEYEADSFDLSGNVIPELHAEGIVRGTRITVR
jgi:hypothetical protein